MRLRWTGYMSAGVLLLAGVVHAEVLYKLTFDTAGDENGVPDAPYNPGTCCTQPAETAIKRLDPKEGAPSKIVPSTGFQGGKALAITTPRGGNTGYLATNTAGMIEHAAGVTVEAIIMVDSIPGNLAGIGTQFGTTGIAPTLRFCIPAGGSIENPGLEFSAGAVTLQYLPQKSLLKAWHHIAAIYTTDAGDGQSSAELFVDGVAVARKLVVTAKDHGGQRLVIGGFAFGADAPGVANGRSFTGLIDAVAISDKPLIPAKFVLPTHAPAK
ncbi:MAG: LamG-like jellyroll fold domain-containing protein [Phycisphaerae bacterium]